MCKSANASCGYQDTRGQYTEFDQNFNLEKKRHSIKKNIEKMLMRNICLLVYIVYNSVSIL